MTRNLGADLDVQALGHLYSLHPFRVPGRGHAGGALRS